MNRHFGKSLEAVARLIRPFLLPKYRKAYAALLARGLGERREGEPIVCCDFSNPAIDAVGGRYYFSLVRDLIDAGYFPVFTARRGTLSTFGTSPLKSLLLSERLGVIRSLDELKEPYFLITDDATAAPEHATKIVLADYQWRVCRNPNELAFPFFIHPWIAKGIKKLRPPGGIETRAARLFFGGSTRLAEYDKDVIRDDYGMLSRLEMLEVAAAAIPREKIHQPSDTAEWLASSEFHPFVYCETQHSKIRQSEKCNIPPDRWLDALAKADFFFACPGADMPLCHNVIEAMAAGCVPILQYGSYLSPPLQDHVHCLAFHDAKSLHDVLHRIFSMNEGEIVALRANVRAHFAEHLAPGRFAQRLFSGMHDQRILLLNDYRVPR